MFLLQALVYVGIFILITNSIFPAMYERADISVEDPHYAAYYDDGEIPPCDTACVKKMVEQMIRQTLEEYGYPDKRRIP